MPDSKIHILSTRPVDATAIHAAQLKGIIIHEKSFIETSPVHSGEVACKIKASLRLPLTVIFTSMSSVEVIAGYMSDSLPKWKIYCIGNTTMELVTKYFGETAVAGTADNATDLARVILAGVNINEVSFFCGDQRRDDLPDLLRKNHIAVNEIEVYQTIPLSHKINNAYDGILFFSPSAVSSFFSENEIDKQTKLFAIGPTTADAIKKYTNNMIVVADTPGKNNLIDQMISYFLKETDERIKE